MRHRQRRGSCLGAALISSLLLAACGGSHQPTHTDHRHEITHHLSSPPNATVTVTDRQRQPIDGWGISVVGDTEHNPLVVPRLPASEVGRLDRLVFEQAGVNLVRVFGPGYGSQLQTGDFRPRLTDRRFAFMRRVRPYGVRFMLTGADAPASLRAGTAAQGGGLATDADRAYADYLFSLIRFARERAGVPFDYAAIGNEPDNGRSLLTLHARQAAQVYQLLAERLQSAGSPTRLVIGDNTTWGATLGYATEALAQPAVSASAAAIASHSYGGSSEEMRAVAKLARSHGLPVWQTEWGTGCIGCPDDDSMDTALRWSTEIAAALVQGQASAWFAFKGVALSSHGPADGLIVRTEGGPEPFHTTKRFDVFRQYSSVAPPGSHRLDTQVSSDRVLAVAFQSGKGMAVVLSNLAPQTTILSLDLGSRSGPLSGRRTDSHARFQPIQVMTYAGGPLNLTLPAKSVTTLTLQKD
ncbi:MAG: glycosyl hydrolase [Solirubrobacterales bacterium]